MFHPDIGQFCLGFVRAMTAIASSGVVCVLRLCFVMELNNEKETHF